MFNLPPNQALPPKINSSPKKRALALHLGAARQKYLNYSYIKIALNPSSVSQLGVRAQKISKLSLYKAALRPSSVPQLGVRAQKVPK
jgi:hypothetical protein